MLFVALVSVNVEFRFRKCSLFISLLPLLSCSDAVAASTAAAAAAVAAVKLGFKNDDFVLLMLPLEISRLDD